MTRPGDILVVGAGVVGCAVACELARRGASVEVVDDRAAGMGATQASAGILAPYIEADEGSPLLDLTVRALDVFEPFLQCVLESSDVRVGYQRCGTVDVAFGSDTMARFGDVHRHLSARGVRADLLDQPALRECEPEISPEAIGGLFIPSHGYVAAHDFTRSLVAAARKRGVRILEQGRVRRIARQGREMVVSTERGTLTADAVVIAGGSWSGQIEVEGVDAAVPVRPVRGQLLHLAWQGSPLRHVTWGEHRYLVPWEDGTLLVGATAEDVGFDERPTAGGVSELLVAACRLAPRARQAGFISARAGLRPATPDSLPVIGPSSQVPGLVYATGHFRNGVLLAPLTAQFVADFMIDGRRDPMVAITAPERFRL